MRSREDAKLCTHLNGEINFLAFALEVVLHCAGFEVFTAVTMEIVVF
jgi:hypothetical protein